MTRVHIVTVHHRGKRMLTHCLESLLACGGVESRIVVVANGRQVEMPELAESEPRIGVVRLAEAVGFGRANNLGVEWADRHLGSCDAYYFVNNDTLSEPDSLARLCSVLKERQEAAIVGPKLVIWGAESHLNSLGINVSEDGWAWDEGIGQRLSDYGALPDLRSVLAVTGSALLIRAEAFNELGRWPEIYDYYLEDIDLCLRAWRQGYTVLNAPEATVRHRISATMTSGWEHKHFLFLRNRLLLACIHWPPELLHAVALKILDELASAAGEDFDRRGAAVREALQKIPEALRLREEMPQGSTDWVDLLRPVGSVPPIRLPDSRLSDVEEHGPVRDEASAGVATLNGAVESGRRDLARAATEWWATRCDGRRVLVLGWSPLPLDEAQMNYAPGVRSWQLARGLAEAGHRVCLFCRPIPGAGGRHETEAGGAEVVEGIFVGRLGRSAYETAPFLPLLVEKGEVDVVVGATALPSRRAVEVAGDRPVWVDVFGDPMAEAQAKESVVCKGDHLLAYSELLGSLLERGDAFSVVSDRQRWALIGQLGFAGRLNRATGGTELVTTIPCSLPPRPSPGRGPFPVDDVPSDAFVVLWSGGFNTWCDVETLYAGLDSAMADIPSLHFVATGGSIRGHDEATYPRFTDLVECSSHRERFHLLGQLATSDVARYSVRADLGIVTERPIYERALGSSQRLLGWLAEGLPFVCTSVSELGGQLEEAGACLSYPPGDSEALAETLRRAARDPGLLQTMKSRIRGLPADAEVGIEQLAAWVARARRAPDAGLENPLASERRAGTAALLRRRLASLQEEAAELEDRYHRVRGELGAVHQSRMWRLSTAYYGARLFLGRMFRR